MWWQSYRDEVAAICTDRQKEILEAVEKHGSKPAAAKALNLNERSIRKTVARVKRRFTDIYGIDEQIAQKAPLAGSQALSGTSTLVRFPEDDAGGRVMQWVKANVSKDEKYKVIQEAIEEFAENYQGVHEPTKPPEDVTDDLLTCYMWGDPHIGMYAWAEETGSDFNLHIAETLMIEATQRLINSAPPSKEALIVNLGDFFHADNLENKTARSGHVLDMDTRMSKVYQVGVMIQHMCIDAALKKHEKVKVIEAIGNHDDLTSMTLATTMAAWYRNEPRVEIVTTRNKFHWHEFGKVMLCVTHGDTVKAKDMGEIMASYERGKLWGRTDWRYAYMGHIHRNERHKTPGRGWSAESFATLAGLDAWGASKGFYPEREMVSIVHHRDYGEKERHRVCIDMLP